MDINSIVTAGVGLASGIGAYMKARYDLKGLREQNSRLNDEHEECERRSDALERELARVGQTNAAQATEIANLSASLATVMVFLRGSQQVG